MRKLKHLKKNRIHCPDVENLMDGDFLGAYLLRLRGSALEFLVLASVHDGEWEHVSVSTESRCPRWGEMQQIKELFFEDDEAVMQLHPPQKDYVNSHPYCLHMWRPIKARIPLPDVNMV